MSLQKYDFDLMVIGGGSGGVRAGRFAAGLGAKVAITEENRYGGTCVLRGCIPKKLMLAGSEFPAQAQYFSSYAWSIGDFSLNWSLQQSAREKELKRLEGIYENLLSQTGVKVLKGRGHILSPHKVEVEGKTYSSRFVLIAVGGEPFTPDVEGVKYGLTSDDMFKLSKCPRSLLIMGGGYIALEFASIFKGYGSKVQVVFRKDLPLRGFDQDVRAFLMEEMSKQGIEMIPKSSLKKVEKKEQELEVSLSNGQTKTVEQVLFATGRRPKTKNLNLDSLGVKTNARGEIEVNEYFETSVKGIYALGDSANTPYQLTPTALAEAMLLAKHLFADSKKTMDYEFVPTAVFSTPPVAVVGLTEEQARQKGHDVAIYVSRFRPLKYTVTSLNKKTFIKMVTDKKTDKVLGIFMVGEDAPEIMQGMAVALKAGAKKSDFDNTIGIHPTSAEELVTLRTPVSS